MANFSYSEYQNVIAKAQNGSANNAVKVGFFKLKNDGDEALIRINVGSMEDLQFATVHQLGAAQKWMKVGCLNPVGSYSDNCPLCSAVAAGNTAIGKASKKVYVQMLVSYKDAATGQFSAAIPVIWERPAGFSREIANYIRDYGNLKEIILKVTRNGVAGDMKTTYSIGFIPLYNKPELVPAEGLAAFDNFNIAKHSYWEKTAEEILTFLQTGSFPEKVATVAPTAAPAAAPATYAQPNVITTTTPYVAPAPAVNEAFTAPVTTQPVTTTPDAATPVRTAGPVVGGSENTSERPVRNFNFSF